MPFAAAEFWSSAEGGVVHCALCPRACRLAPGATGACGVRRNSGGAMSLPYQGLISSLALDPIEKKPLARFLPGTEVFSVGFLGCNLRCPFCQNWSISQATRADAGLAPSFAAEAAAACRSLSPSELVGLARDSRAPSIAFTYSEPLVHVEYVLEAARLARAAGLKTVLVSNGCVTEPATRAVLPAFDAANIDLKCFSADDYRLRLGGDLEAVKTFIALAARSLHLEVTTLLVPGLSADLDTVAAIAAFLAALPGPPVLHLSGYHPAFRSDAKPTDPDLIEALAEAARRRLPDVLEGNLPRARRHRHRFP